VQRFFDQVERGHYPPSSLQKTFGCEKPERDADSQYTSKIVDFGPHPHILPDREKPLATGPSHRLLIGEAVWNGWRTIFLNGLLSTIVVP